VSRSAEQGEARFLAVIGDIRGSRETRARAQLQTRLAADLARVNRELKGALAAGFVITLGDEFQGLLADPAAAVRALISLEAALAGIPIRYGLGWGALATARRKLAIGMDGACFHAAREALSREKRLDRWVTVSGFGPEEDAALNGIYSLMGAVRAGWTPTQAATVALMRRLSVQKEVAAARGVTVSTVHKALSGALYVPMTEAERAAGGLLARFARTPSA
jgi:hypothetical protein